MGGAAHRAAPERRVAERRAQERLAQERPARPARGRAAREPRARGRRARPGTGTSGAGMAGGTGVAGGGGSGRGGSTGGSGGGAGRGEWAPLEQARAHRAPPVRVRANRALVDWRRTDVPLPRHRRASGVRRTRQSRCRGSRHRPGSERWTCAPRPATTHGSGIRWWGRARGLLPGTYDYYYRLDKAGPASRSTTRQNPERGRGAAGRHRDDATPGSAGRRRVGRVTSNGGIPPGLRRGRPSPPDRPPATRRHWACPRRRSSQGRTTCTTSPPGTLAGGPLNNAAKLQSGMVAARPLLTITVDVPRTAVSGKFTIAGSSVRMGTDAVGLFLQTPASTPRRSPRSSAPTRPR